MNRKELWMKYIFPSTAQQYGSLSWTIKRYILATITTEHLLGIKKGNLHGKKDWKEILID
jgi:hypothetical protein